MFVLGLVYWGITPQQPGSYRGGDDNDEMSVSMVQERLFVFAITAEKFHVSYNSGPVTWYAMFAL